MSITIRPFDEQGRYTEFHNYVLDCLMPQLSPNAWKCLCFIIRKTKGWHKDSDDLSFSQIKKGTGIKSDPTVSKALKELEQASCILVKRKPDDQWASNTYRLNTALEITVDNQEPTIDSIAEELVPTIENIVVPTIENIVEPTIESIDTKESKRNKDNVPVVSKNGHTATGEKKNKPLTENQRMFGALAQICEINWQIAPDHIVKNLNQSEKILRLKAQATPEELLEFGEWWKVNDWRGQKGQPPTPAQVREMWQRFKNTQQPKRMVLK